MMIPTKTIYLVQGVTGWTPGGVRAWVVGWCETYAKAESIVAGLNAMVYRADAEWNAESRRVHGMPSQVFCDELRKRCREVDPQFETDRTTTYEVVEATRLVTKEG